MITFNRGLTAAENWHNGFRRENGVGRKCTACTIENIGAVEELVLS